MNKQKSDSLRTIKEIINFFYMRLCNRNKNNTFFTEILLN